MIVQIIMWGGREINTKKKLVSIYDMESRNRENDFEKELKKYLEYLEDTRNEMWTLFIKPANNILFTNALTSDEKLKELLKISVMFNDITSSWAFKTNMIV